MLAQQQDTAEMTLTLTLTQAPASGLEAAIINDHRTVSCRTIFEKVRTPDGVYLAFIAGELRRI